MVDEIKGVLEVENGNDELKVVMDLINNAVSEQPTQVVLAALIALLAIGADKVRKLEQSLHDEELPPAVNMYGSIVGFDYSLHFRPSEENAEGEAVH